MDAMLQVVHHDDESQLGSYHWKKSVCADHEFITMMLSLAYLLCVRSVDAKPRISACRRSRHREFKLHEEQGIYYQNMTGNSPPFIIPNCTPIEIAIFTVFSSPCPFIYLRPH